MYRCITELKGLIIDIDSFPEQLDDWKSIAEKFKCLFVTSDENKILNLKKCGIEKSYKQKPYDKFLWPNEITHTKALQELQLNATEVAYVSKDITFLEKAGRFLGGTIWLTPNITYRQASVSPDLICGYLKTLERFLDNNIKGFLGETYIDSSKEKRGIIPQTELDVDGITIPVHFLGRYFGYSHYMSQLHPYSSAIFLNKKRGKAYRKYDDRFANLYIAACKLITANEKIAGVCCVPNRPGTDERFDVICSKIAENCKINDLRTNFKCIRNYPTQKNLDAVAREENVAGCFQYNGNLNGQDIILIDDILSTGSTVKECVRTLKGAGANKIHIVTLAINQLGGSYWSSETAQISCPKCGDKMILSINGTNGTFFYRCRACHKTIDFSQGKNMLREQVNLEMEKYKDS